MKPADWPHQASGHHKGGKSDSQAYSADRKYGSTNALQDRDGETGAGYDPQTIVLFHSKSDLSEPLSRPSVFRLAQAVPGRQSKTPGRAYY